MSRISAASCKAETAPNLRGLSITNKLTNRGAWGLERPALVEAGPPCLTPLAVRKLVLIRQYHIQISYNGLHCIIWLHLYSPLYWMLTKLCVDGVVHYVLLMCCTAD